MTTAKLVETTYKIEGVERLDLFVTNCSCGHLTTHGFWQRLEWDHDIPNLKVTAKLACEECGKDSSQTFNLIPVAKVPA